MFLLGVGVGVGVIVAAITIKIWRKLTTEKCTCTARLDGKTVLLTGGNAGIGKATAMEIAKRGARLILASRNVEKSKIVQAEIINKTGNSNIDVRHLDFKSLASVRKFCKDFVSTERRLDVLINNAGCIVNGGELTADGNEVGMQVNHLGPFLLTNLLLDLLKSSAPSRIVVVSSAAHTFGDKYLNPKDLNYLPAFSPKLFSEFLLYCVTKLCNMLMVKELEKGLRGTEFAEFAEYDTGVVPCKFYLHYDGQLWRMNVFTSDFYDSGVTVNGVHPGAIKTEIWSDMPKICMHIGTVLSWPFLINTYEGAQTTVHVAISEKLQGISGKFFANCKVAEKSKMADDEEVARTVWESSWKLVQEKKK